MPQIRKQARCLKNSRASKFAKKYVKCLNKKEPKIMRKKICQKVICEKQHENFLFLDVDGTIINFRHVYSQGVVPRPYLESFFRRVNKHFDIILFSRGTAEHVEFVRHRYCSNM